MSVSRETPRLPRGTHLSQGTPGTLSRHRFPEDTVRNETTSGIPLCNEDVRLQLSDSHLFLDYDFLEEFLVTGNSRFPGHKPRLAEIQLIAEKAQYADSINPPAMQAAHVATTSAEHTAIQKSEIERVTINIAARESPVEESREGTPKATQISTILIHSSGEALRQPYASIACAAPSHI